MHRAAARRPAAACPPCIQALLPSRRLLRSLAACGVAVTSRGCLVLPTTTETLPQAYLVAGSSSYAGLQTRGWACTSARTGTSRVLSKCCAPQADLVKMAHQQRLALEAEIASYKREEAHQQGIIAGLMKQKAQAATEAEEAAASLGQATADCQARDAIIASLHTQARRPSELPPGQTMC